MWLRIEGEVSFEDMCTWNEEHECIRKERKKGKQQKET